MKSKRFNVALLLGLAAIALPVLGGCASKTSSNAAVYYKVEYYTDFGGIDYEKPFNLTAQPNVANAILVGHDYVLASTTSSRATHFGDDHIYDPTNKTKGSEAYDKVSLQTAVTGHHYAFQGWKGTYGAYSNQVSSNTKSVQSVKRAAATSAATSSASSSASTASSSTIEWTEGENINTSYILGNCKLYAYFKSVIDTYTVRFYNWDGSVAQSTQGDYGQTIGDVITLTDPVHNQGTDPYYKTYAFAGWTNKTNPLDTTVYSTADLAKWVLARDIDFQATYTETTNAYKVSFYNSELKNGSWVSASAIGSLSNVTYDTAADFKQATISDPTQLDANGDPYYANANPGQSYHFTGWSGTYDSAADPSLLGKSVDLAHLRGDCSVHAIYSDKTSTYSVKYMELASDAGTSADVLLYTDTVDYGGHSAFSGTLPTVSNKTFGGWTNQTGTVFSSLTNIQSDKTVYASFAATTLSLSDPTAGSFTYTFDASSEGYALSAYAVGTDMVLDSADWALQTFPSLYPLRKINPSVFSNLALTAVSLPSTVLVVGSNAFNGCHALVSIDLGGSVDSLSSLLFTECIALTTVNGLDSVTSIEQRAFSSCIALSAISLPSNLTAIKANAFDSCTALASLTLPANLLSIGSQAFQNCVKLTSLSIPSKVTTLGSYIVNGCTGLTGVSVGVSEAVAKTRAYDAKWNYVSETVALPITYA